MLAAAAMASRMLPAAEAKHYHRKLRMAPEGAGIAGQFIVILKDLVTDESEQTAISLRGTRQNQHGFGNELEGKLNKFKISLHALEEFDASGRDRCGNRAHAPRC